jgi:Ca-activated chloride channel family protein
MVALVLALARPQRINREVVVESEGIDIVLALDISGSMEALDFRAGGRKLTRLAVAKRVVADFVEGRPLDRIGLVVFGEEAFTQVPLTLDHAALLSFLDSIQIGMAGANRTAVGQAVAVSARQLAALEGSSSVVILLTDGSNNVVPLDPLQAARAAQALGVRIHTIGVGSEGGASRGFFSLGRTEEVDMETLQAIADATGGQSFRATDTRALLKIYDTIDEMETTTAEVTELVHREELFRLALVPGLFLLALQLLLGQTVLRRLP